MIDPVVERKASDLKELQAQWSKFNDFFIMGAKGEGLTPDKDAQFLELKSRIAMLHDSFLESVEHGHKIAQDMLAIVERAITLKHLARMSVAEIKKIKLEWHDAYLLLHETIAVLEEERERFAAIPQSQYAFNKFKKNLITNVQNVLNSTFFKLFVVFAVILFVVWGVPAFGIYDYKKLHDIKATQKPYDFLAKYYRKILNSNFPYFKLAEIEQKTEGAPARDKDDQVIKDLIKNRSFRIQYFTKRGVASLINSSVEERFEIYKTARESYLRLALFRIKETSQAKELLRETRDALSQRDPSSKVQISVFRKSNVIGFIEYSENDREIADFLIDTAFGGKRD